VLEVLEQPCVLGDCEHDARNQEHPGGHASRGGSRGVARPHPPLLKTKAIVWVYGAVTKALLSAWSA
jgi:hypothetical protein